MRLSSVYRSAFILAALSFPSLCAVAQDSQDTALPAFLPQGRSKAFLGVVTTPIDDGARVEDVVANSPAFTLGLQVGDLIVEVDDFRLGTASGPTYSLPSEMRRSGTEVKLLIRDGQSGQTFVRNVQVGGVAANKGRAGQTPRLGVASQIQDDGETIVGVAPNSIAARAGLSVGDLVTAIDGYRIGIIDGNTYSLASEVRHSSARCLLTVIRGGQELPLFADFGLQPVSTSRVHTLLIGLTADGRIGAGCKSNLDALESRLAGLPRQKRGAAIRIDGNDCRADRILQVVRDLAIQSDEALFCYYAGHGGYDPNQNDPADKSGGHYFSIPNGDLLRKTLMTELRSKGAKLTVLITDTCNVPGVPIDPRFAPTALMPPEPPIVTLLLRHSGVLDISGSARDQFGWFYPSGGIFTKGLNLALLGGGSSWTAILDASAQFTRSQFREMKRQAAQGPGGWDPVTLQQLNGQADQFPQAFEFNVKLD